MLSRLGVRSKILATLAVPVLALILAVVLISTSAINDSRESRAALNFIEGLDLLRDVGVAASVERLASLQFIESDRPEDESADPDEPTVYDQLQAARDDTDTALAAYDSHIDSLDLSLYDSSVVAAVDNARDARAGIANTRFLVDTTYSLSNAIDAFGALSRAHFAEYRALAGSIPDRSVAADLIAAVDLMEYTDHLTIDGPFGSALIANLGNGVQPSPAANELLIDMLREGNILRSQAADTLASLENPELSMPLRDQGYGARRSLVMSGGGIESVADAPEIWVEAVENEIDYFRQLNLTASGITSEKAEQSANNARTTAIFTVAGAALVVLISIIVALLISRRITEPLRRLTAAAANVRDELPNLVQQVAVPGQGPDLTLASVPVESRDEVGQLASVFNSVNETTIEVAQEQAALRGSIAEMFVNVARRDQVLLNRQLGFLDELERNEEDPGALADLFRLDHLATRMRRNAESLLILAGIDTGRRIRTTMPLSDVVRTATSEIELYDRVYLEIVDDPLMMGHTALNVAHLLAEILENATQFSDPSTRVEVTTRHNGDMVEVEIRDYGLGMSDDELAEANRRASQSQASEILGSQHLGLYVVGRLASRLDVQVRFNAPEDGPGTQALVHLPQTMFTTDELPDTPKQQESYEALPPMQDMALIDDYESQAAVDAYQPQMAEAAKPLAVREVDLDALTDGQTSAGMPRRKTALPQRPAAAAEPPAPPVPATGPVAATGPVPAVLGSDGEVLPPLLAPQLDAEALSEEAFTWTAPQPELTGRSPLPSRQRKTDTPASGASAVEPEDAAPTVPGRTLLFSNFRGREELDSSTESAPPAVPAAPPQDELPPFPTRRARHMANVPPDSGPMPHALPEITALAEAAPGATQVQSVPLLEDDPIAVPQLEPDDVPVPPSFDDAISSDVALDAMHVEPARAEATPNLAPVPAFEPVAATFADAEPVIGQEEYSAPPVRETATAPVRNSALSPPPVPPENTEEPKRSRLGRFFSKRKPEPEEEPQYAWKPPAPTDEDNTPAPVEPSSVESPWSPPSVPQEASWQPEQGWQTQPSPEAATSSVQRDEWAPPTDERHSGWAMPVFDDEAQERLRTASGIQEQAMAQLSQLSSYRPRSSSTGSGSLARRVPSQIPSSTKNTETGAISRDAAELRARLSAFQSATTRAREESTGTGEQDPTVNAVRGNHEEER